MTEKMLRNTLKFGFVASCCAIAAWAAASAQPLVRTIVCVLLFTILTLTRRMQGHGKRSESWLTLAYGSWMTAQFALLLGVLMDISIGRLNRWAGSVLAVIAFFGYQGIKAASLGP